ncbi:MAG: phosphomannomutase [Myxococcales bacterium]|nr:phosphomannomutase [Myxococcales bacterium]
MSDFPEEVFRAYDIRGLVDEQITQGFARALGRSFGARISAMGGKRCLVGYDARHSGPTLSQALAEGLAEQGLEVAQIGAVASPILYWAAHRDQGHGIMVTGSHNPAPYNGFKMVLGGASIHGATVSALREQMIDPPPALDGGRIIEEDWTGPYQADLLQRLNPLGRPIKVVVDAGNGMGGLALPLLTGMGAEVIGIHCEADGDFPNHHPDPTVEANLVELQACVRREQAAAGIAFDGDVDRIGVVDEFGTVIWGDLLTALFAKDILKQHPGATIIGEVKCSSALYDGIEALGGQAIMWKAGHSLIKGKMKETGALLAGEMSGHLFFADRYDGFDDAIYAAGRLLELLDRDARPLSAQIADFPRLASSPEIRRPVADEATKFALVEAATAYFRARGPVIDIDGVRVPFDGGWGLVRASNTQSILVLRFEAETRERLQQIQEEVEAVLDQLERRL